MPTMYSYYSRQFTHTCRGAGNRTRAARSQSAYTTIMLHPVSLAHLCCVLVDENVPLFGRHRYNAPMDTETSENARSYDDHADGWFRSMPTNPGHIYIEKPAMDGALPEDLTGIRVLSVGTGSGEELSMLIKRNPRHIIAIDISEKLLDIARRSYPDLECHTMDMMDLSFPDASFGLVYSSLAFHYAKDWDTLLKGVFRVTRPGGILLFSTHHPGYWSKGATGAAHTNERGITLTEHEAVLPGGVHIVYYNHKDTSSLRDAVENAGFIIETLQEPAVVTQKNLPLREKKRYENMVVTNAKTPLFHVIRARRPQ